MFCFDMIVCFEFNDSIVWESVEMFDQVYG